MIFVYLFSIAVWVYVFFIVRDMPLTRRWQWFITFAIITTYTLSTLFIFTCDWRVGVIMLSPLTISAWYTHHHIMMWYLDAPRCVECDCLARDERPLSMIGEDVVYEQVCRRHKEDNV